MMEHDPDAFEDFLEDDLAEVCEDVEIDESIVDGVSDDSVDDSIIEEALISGAIFGFGVEEGQNESTQNTGHSSKSRPISAAEYLRGKERKKTKLRPFEQWVEDFICGKKDIKDGLWDKDNREEGL